jgi:metallo-beta-lactamase family protein
VRAGVFLVHGEPEALTALKSRLEGAMAGAGVVVPELDACHALAEGGAQRLEGDQPPRLRPEQVARLDWHNDVSRLILDINEALRDQPDEKTRLVLIRRLRRALAED